MAIRDGIREVKHDVALWVDTVPARFFVTFNIVETQHESCKLVWGWSVLVGDDCVGGCRSRILFDSAPSQVSVDLESWRRLGSLATWRKLNSVD